MTPAELVLWQRRNGLRTDAEAADKLGLSIYAYRRLRRGQCTIGQQTVMLSEYYELLNQISPMKLASLSDVVCKMLRLAILVR